MEVLTTWLKDHPMMPVLMVAAALIGTESGYIPTPQRNSINDLENRLIMAEAAIHQASFKDELLNEAIDDVKNQVDSNTKLLHTIDNTQARMDQKLDDLTTNLDKDLDRIIEAIEDNKKRPQEPPCIKNGPGPPPRGAPRDDFYSCRLWRPHPDSNRSFQRDRLVS